MLYTQLTSSSEDEEYTVKIANNVSDAVQLIEKGFQYATEIDGAKLFRKHK